MRASGYCGTFLFVLVAWFDAATADARQFRSSDVAGLGSPTVDAVEYMGTVLSGSTGGRYGVSVDHDDKDSENFTIAQVRAGTLDMARVSLAVFNSRVPATIVPSLPFLFRSNWHLRRVLDGPIGEEILASLEADGFIALCFYDTGARSFYSTRGPIRSVDDMKGLAVRVQPSDSSADLIKAMGARPVAIPYDRVAAALKAGVVDASENNLPAYVGAGHATIARYYSFTEHSMMPSVLVFSKRVWTELPAVDQRAIRAAAKESVSFMRGRFDGFQVSSRLTAETSGAEMIDTVDRKSFADILKPFYPKLLPDPALQGMIREIQADVAVSSVP